MKCTDPKRAGELVLQHAGLLAQMAAIVDDANRTGRELRGDELLRHDRLAGQAEKVLADLRVIDPLAAKVAGQGLQTRVAPTAASPVAVDRRTAPPPQSGINAIMQRIRDGVVHDRSRGRKP